MEWSWRAIGWSGWRTARLRWCRAAEEHPDLVLLDLSLPKRDGMEVLAELRARHDDAAVLVLSGRNDLNARVQCLDLGADDYLLKPFSYL